MNFKRFSQTFHIFSETAFQENEIPRSYLRRKQKALCQRLCLPGNILLKADPAGTALRDQSHHFA
ncbi:MAG: hypothetical protein V8T10_05370 [Merdibacter sp.]